MLPAPAAVPPIVLLEESFVIQIPTPALPNVEDPPALVPMKLPSIKLPEVLLARSIPSLPLPAMTLPALAACRQSPVAVG